MRYPFCSSWASRGSSASCEVLTEGIMALQPCHSVKSGCWTPGCVQGLIWHSVQVFTEFIHVQYHGNKDLGLHKGKASETFPFVRGFTNISSVKPPKKLPVFSVIIQSSVEATSAAPAWSCCGRCSAAVHSPWG